jgi:outer membrane protein OmpA-like peptidoglycan-associated protein
MKAARWVTLVVSAGLLAACGGKKDEPPPMAPMAQPTASAPAMPPKPAYTGKRFTVTFPTGSSKLSRQADNEIRAAAAYLRQGGNAVVVTATGSGSDDRRKHTLATDRAVRVTSALIKSGVPATQVGMRTESGQGVSTPAPEPQPARGRNKPRRASMPRGADDRTVMIDVQ